MFLFCLFLEREMNSRIKLKCYITQCWTVNTQRKWIEICFTYFMNRYLTYSIVNKSVPDLDLSMLWVYGSIIVPLYLFPEQKLTPYWMRVLTHHFLALSIFWVNGSILVSLYLFTRTETNSVLNESVNTLFPVLSILWVYVSKNVLYCLFLRNVPLLLISSTETELATYWIKVFTN